jgi:hypothetical protein
MKEGMSEDDAAPDPEVQYVYDFCKNASQVVVGIAGEDDLQWDLWASSASAAQATAMARSCRELLAAKKEVAAKKLPEAEPLLTLLRRMTIHRDGTILTVHTDLPSGFNELLAPWANEFLGTK